MSFKPDHRNQKSTAWSLTVGVLSKMTTPWSRAGRRLETVDLRWVVHHHPIADPATVARIPRVRLFTKTSGT
jgi:hypothetical protein